MVKNLLLFFFFFTVIFIYAENNFSENEVSFIKNNYKILKKNEFTYKVNYNFKKASFDELSFLGFFTLKLYQFFISSQDKETCIFHPHCSLYAQIAINKYGIVKGGIMSSSRVLRCNGFGGSYYTHIAPDGKIIDPTERNYLWKKLKY